MSQKTRWITDSRAGNEFPHFNLSYDFRKEYNYDYSIMTYRWTQNKRRMIHSVRTSCGIIVCWMSIFNRDFRRQRRSRRKTMLVPMNSHRNSESDPFSNGFKRRWNEEVTMILSFNAYCFSTGVYFVFTGSEGMSISCPTDWPKTASCHHLPWSTHQKTRLASLKTGLDLFWGPFNFLNAIKKWMGFCPHL